MGICSTLLSSKHEINFVVACDIPDLDMNYVKELIAEAKDQAFICIGGC